MRASLDTWTFFLLNLERLAVVQSGGAGGRLGA